MTPKVFASAFAFILSLTFPRSLSADEVRIVDPLGLTRAYQRLRPDELVDVKVRLQAVEQAIHPSGLLLTGGSRIAKDREAVGGSEGEYHFYDVPSGIWRLKLPDRNTLLLAVSILSRSREVEVDELVDQELQTVLENSEE